ncbi:MAG: hypothetical protein ACI82F_001522 [Planctomycetota bacterium]|jgi:hypothetical protein
MEELRRRLSSRGTTPLAIEWGTQTVAFRPIGALDPVHSLDGIQLALFGLDSEGLGPHESGSCWFSTDC